LRFGVQVDYGAGPVTLESDFSKPLLVMTNESQYGDALKIIFVKDVFANVVSTSRTNISFAILTGNRVR